MVPKSLGEVGNVWSMTSSKVQLTCQGKYRKHARYTHSVHGSTSRPRAIDLGERDQILGYHVSYVVSLCGEWEAPKVYSIAPW